MLPRVSMVESEEVKYLLFSTNDAISNVLYQTGKWQDHLLQITYFFINGIENPLVLDIGANLGAYSIPLAKKIQDIGGQVIGFEPQRIVYYQLCGNIFLNRLQNCHAIYGAVGEKQSEIEIPEVNYENNHNVGAFSLEEQYRNQLGLGHTIKNDKCRVPLISLDEFKCEKPPSFIKIDVEGFEINVLKGATKFLQKNGYPPILFEAWDFDWYVDARVDFPVKATN